MRLPRPMQSGDRSHTCDAPALGGVGHEGKQALCIGGFMPKRQSDKAVTLLQIRNEAREMGKGKPGHW